MNTKERMQLSCQSGFALQTVSNWDIGKRVNESTDAALVALAKRLGILDQRGKKRTKR